MLTSWVSAQNSGNFKQYEALYAERFTGIKRAASRTTQFDRKGWLEDRKGMFEKPFTVTVSGERFVIAGEIAVIEFTQTWASARFRDQGPKELLIANGQDLLISREEMKASQLAGSEPTPLSPRAFSFVYSLPQGPVLMFGGPVDLNAVTGHPEYVSDTVARRPVLTTALKAEQQALVGKTFALYSGTGHVCDASVTGFVVVTRATPHFGTLQAWHGEQGAPPVPLPQRATELWRFGMMEGNYLAATLSVDKCPGAVFGRDKELPPPKLWSANEVPSAEVIGAIAAIRQTPLHRQWQAEFEKVTGEKRPWDTTAGVPDAEKRLVRAFEDGSGQRLISVATSGGTFECSSEFAIRHWFVVRRQAERFVVLPSRPEDIHENVFDDRVFGDIAVDLEQDGTPEFISGFKLLQSSSTGYRAVLDLPAGYFDCPC